MVQSFPVATLESTSPSVSGPASPFFNVGDIADLLPAPARDRLVALRQRADDASSLTYNLMDQREDARLHRLDLHERRKRLLQSRSEGGFALSEEDPQVREIQKRLDNADAEHKRLSELAGARADQRSSARRLVESVEKFLRIGIPGDMSLAGYAAEPPVLKKGESVTDAVERLRRRVRELRADIHRVRSAPFHSAGAKNRARAQIKALAEQGRPSVLGMVETDHDPLSFREKHYIGLVRYSEPGASATIVMPDTLGLLAFVFKDALTAAIEKEIDEVADDELALTSAQRHAQEQTILSDILFVEREECALVETAIAQGLNVNYREDCSPLAILGLKLVAGA